MYSQENDFSNQIILRIELLWPEIEFNPILLEEIDTRERLATPMSSNKNAAHHVEANRKSQR